jgi:hypothetical protein
MGDQLGGISDVLAATMLLVAGYCVGRLVLSLRSRVRTRRDADVVHDVMGVSMAGMLAPSLAAGPTDMWVLVFLASTVWFGWRVVRDADLEAVGSRAFGQHLPHLLMSAAMVYMILIAWSGSMGSSQQGSMMAMGSSGAGAAPWSFLTVALALVLVGEGALTLGRTLRRVIPQPQGASLSAQMMAPSGGSHGATGPDASVLLVAARQSDVPSVRVLAPRSVMVCQVAMSLVMGFMLLSLV